MPAAAQEFAFVSWDGSSGRRACPLATFGSRASQTLHAHLACAEPPRADQPTLKNAAELRGAIALVVRGGCSFAHKARLLQRAGAVAMLLANNTREEPLAAFTMGESPEELEQLQAGAEEPITMPCVMMSLRDVRELFQKFPPSVKTGTLDFEVLSSDEGVLVAEECLRVQRELHEAAEAGKGWKAIKRTTTSIIKMLEPQGMTAVGSSTSETPAVVTSGQDEDVKPKDSAAADDDSTREKRPPLLAFVQWATSASTYEICFAPLADFCSARAGASYTGKLVACDPLLADKPLKNEELLKGAVAVLRRGSCSFPEKLERVQRAGAVAAIMCNDDEEDLDAAFVMSVDHIDAANAMLPAVMISHKGFLRIQSALNNTTARVLCLAGEAADGLLASSEKAISFRSLPVPSRRHVIENSDTLAHDPLFDLHVACRDGDHAACQRVLAGIVDEAAKLELLSAPCPSGGLTALHQACASGNDNIVELLLQLGAAPNVVDLAMQTPLHVACAYSHIDCARLLLRAEGSASQVPAVLYNADEEYGGLATKRHIGGATAMHEAARAGSAECIELLLASNARLSCTTAQGTETNKFTFLGVNGRDVDGRTPVHIACANAQAECALYLVAANADVDVKDFSGHSPLSLVCKAANDPAKEADAVQIIEKLISLGTTMDECDDGGNQRLVLDHVESPDLRRELEVLYLRHEARRAQLDSQTLRHENETVIKRIEGLEDEVRMLRSVVNAHDCYAHQIQQLQLQMQMILQFQTSYGKHSLSAPATPLLATSFENFAGKSDEEQVLDAALARDLGKKCLRQHQHVLAEQYFKRSQELMPLPGVQRLLEAARRNQQQNAEEEIPVDTFLAAASCSNTLSVATGTTAPSNEKRVKIIHLWEQIEAADATPKARAMLERELRKLEALSDEEEFTLACRWVEWLVALPWGDPNSGLQNCDLYTTKQNEFRQLDAIDARRGEVQRVQAAGKIQRAFRERYAVHMRARSDAAVHIQAIMRGKMTQRRYEAAKQQLLEDQKQRVKSANQQSDKNPVKSAKVDYAVSIDPAIHRKLHHRYFAKELIGGTLFSGQQLEVNSIEQVKGAVKTTRVLQIVGCTESGPAIPFKSKVTNKTPSVFFVWSRWGADLDNMCECSLIGPYEEQQDAQRRFDRITREKKKYDEQGFPGSDAVYESGFDFLRSIVVGGTALSNPSSASSA